MEPQMNTDEHGWQRRKVQAGVARRTKLWGIRSSPFRRDEDIPAFLVSFLGREATAEGKPLTEQEKAVLCAAGQHTSLLPELRVRALRLIQRVMEKNESHSAQDPRTFMTGMEWAEMEDTLVVELAEIVLGKVRA